MLLYFAPQSPEPQEIRHNAPLNQIAYPPHQHPALALPVQTVHSTQQSLKAIWQGSLVF
jgi:hypothetical protein